MAIKVDREERPDVDHIYMNVCQAITGHGGWPLTIFMTPDKKPFFAGTYFPKHNNRGMTGLLGVLDGVTKAWRDNREDLLESSDKIIGAISRTDDDNAEVSEIKEGIIDEALKEFSRSFDKAYGGFSRAPKFPTPHNLYFLLRYWYMTKDKAALDMTLKTLDAMYSGGVYDHIGYGFSRYSTDNKWLVPHFEKMLYDNALLAIAYLEAYQATKIEKYGRAAEEIFTYILRDMTSKEGGYFSAEDADSEGVEGKFYVWSRKEIIEVLGHEDGERVASYYGITERGNFEGENIPNLINSSASDMDASFINECRIKLFNHREKRIHPHKDDKILTAWNGLMIAAMAMGGRILNKKEYTRSAEGAVKFIYEKLVREDGRLLARYRDGESAFLAYVDDYAFLIWGLIELYETTFNSEYLKNAIKLNDDLMRYFWDNESGGLFVYGSDGEQLLTRPKEIYDGATPSGNSVSALNLLRLARLTGKSELEDRAMKLIKTFGRDLESYPSAFVFSLISLQFLKASTKEIIIVEDKKSEEVDKMIRHINDEFRPFIVTLVYSEGDKTLMELVPFLESYTTMGGEAAAYVCQDYSCLNPVTNARDFRNLL